jgi:hypothetical protein
VDSVNTEEIAAVVADEKKPEDTPQSKVEKGNEGPENGEEEQELEDKVCTIMPLLHHFRMCSVAWFSIHV